MSLFVAHSVGLRRGTVAVANGALQTLAAGPARCKSTQMVESECGAVAVGRTYLLPPLSFGGALVVQPWLRFHIPLIEPDMRISRIRLSDKNSCFRVQRLLQFLTSFRS